MSQAELKLLEMVHASSDPEKALEIAFNVIIGFLKQKKAVPGVTTSKDGEGGHETNQRTT